MASASSSSAVEDIYLFVNPKSGGNKGQDFLKVPQPFLTPADDGHLVSLHIFSLIDAAHREEGFTRLKAATDSSRHRVKIIVGGGDGTVMWADSEATSKGIDTPSKLAFGIVPLGTGNDFSRVAGWGGKNPKKILDNDYAVLRQLVRLWSKAQWRPHDVWDCELDVDERDGRILKVEGKREAVQDKTTLKMPMINYFSVGQESKVGLTFDKHRTKSQTCNLIVYACSGITTELQCHSIQHVGDLVSGMHLGLDAEAPVLFGYDEDDEDVPSLVGNPECLMFLNVNSYAGGLGHFWQRKAGCGVKPAPPDEDIDVDADPGDGRLECVSLPSIANIALDQVMHQARRMHSGGPYYLEFFGPPSGVKAMDVYCEVDGEFYHLINPLTATVSFLKRLQVLQNLEDRDMEEWKRWLSPSVWVAQLDDTPLGLGGASKVFADVGEQFGKVFTTIGQGVQGVPQSLMQANQDISGAVSGAVRQANKDMKTAVRSLRQAVAQGIPSPS